MLTRETKCQRDSHVFNCSLEDNTICFLGQQALNMKIRRFEKQKFKRRRKKFSF